MKSIQNERLAYLSVPDAKDAKIISKSISKRKKEMKRVQEFFISEKNVRINKDNQHLLSKLVAISNGKWTGIPKPDPYLPQIRFRDSSQHHTSKLSLHSGFVSKSHQGTLNLAVRKRETERIEHDNRQFAKRLYERGAFI